MKRKQFDSCHLKIPLGRFYHIKIKISIYKTSKLSQRRYKLFFQDRLLALKQQDRGRFAFYSDVLCAYAVVVKPDFMLKEQLEGIDSGIIW